jgi:plasmid replication initiation protein
MKKALVVKDNALINASYHLTLAEQRLILLAIIKARKNKTVIDSSTILRMSAKDYMESFSVEKHAAYEGLKNAAAHLFGRQFSYWTVDKITGKQKKVTSRWVQKVAYIDDAATLELVFSVEVVPLITELEKHFTSYELEQVSALTSAYAVRLYELLIAWRSQGKTPVIVLAVRLYELLIAWRSQGKTPVIVLEEFRQQLGVGVDEHNRMGNFKAKVLDTALHQINTHTDITAAYEQHKAGRVITGFSFTLKQKNSKKLSPRKKIPRQIAALRSAVEKPSLAGRAKTNSERGQQEENRGGERTWKNRTRDVCSQ